MWKHSDKNNRDIFSLHDCRATRMFIAQNNLCFEYNEGFWIGAHTKYNPYAQTLRTDKSQLKIYNFKCSFVWVFEKINHFGKDITQRVSVPIETFMDNINSKKWKLEFLCEYHTYHGVLFECLIWSKEKPYHKECQVQISYEDIEYLWNNLCEDKPW